MANVYRIFVEKKKGNDIEAMQILTDLRQNVGITALTGLRLINRYDVQGVSEAEFRRAVHGVFAEDNLDNTADEVTFAPASGCLPWSSCPANTTSGQTAPPSVFSCSPQENVPR